MLLNSKGKSLKLAGNCVIYDGDAEKFKCEKKTIVITDGIITEVKEFVQNEEDVKKLDDSCIIYPGLSDLHSHVDYNMIQVWDCLQETGDTHWDNRHEWRKSSSYYRDIRDTQGKIDTAWKTRLFADKDGNEIVLGDVMLYFCELQAACGGTTVLQENTGAKSLLGSLDYKNDDSHENAFQYSFLKNDGMNQDLLNADVTENHVKYLVLRSTGVADDLGFPEGKAIMSYVDLYRPGENKPQPKEPETYMPHRETTNWGVDYAVNRDDLVKFISSKNKQWNGFLIHLAEGRAGNIFWTKNSDPLYNGADSYSRREFTEFKSFIRDGIKNGLFTKEDVMDTHINFIHGCGIDLDDKDDFLFIKEYGIGIIWSPVSNLLLYGDTPKAYNYIGDDDLLIGLGSDWSPSGSKHAWDECKFARTFLKKYASDTKNIDEAIMRAVTVNGAKMMGCERIGNIQVGAYADFFVLRSRQTADGSTPSLMDTFYESTDSDVEMVMLGGNVIYGEKECVENISDEKEYFAELETSIESLKGKRVFIPEYFRGVDFKTLYEKYKSEVKQAGLSLSLIRSEEDDDYLKKITALQSSYKGLRQKLVHVDARTVWNDTGIYVDGAVNIIYKSGRCTVSPWAKDLDANGDSGKKGKEGYLLKGENEGALIAKFDENGTPELVKEGKIFYSKKGRLYLGVNDDVNGRYGNGYGDNSGEFIVEVIYE